jgi:hypothetical protein
VKHVISLTILLATGSLFISPNSAAAVDVIEMGSYSFTISIPTTPTMTTTIDNYPRNNSFYGDRNNSDRDRQDLRQQRVIPPNNVYHPPSNRSNCTTTIIGSPIPSPIPIDRNTGQPCR